MPTRIEIGNSPESQLYDRASDIGEKRDLAAARPEISRATAARRDRIRRDGRSRK